MSSRTLTERAAFVAAAIGIAVGLLFLLAPIHVTCMSSASVSATVLPVGATPGTPIVATPGPTVCEAQALWQRQPIFPLPFLAVAVWSLAPSLGYLGVHLRLRGQRLVGSAAIVVGLAPALSSIISFGAAALFIPFVFVPTAIAAQLAFTRS